MESGEIRAAALSIQASTASTSRNPSADRERQPEGRDDRRDDGVQHRDDGGHQQRASEAVDVIPGRIHAATMTPVADTSHATKRRTGSSRGRAGFHTVALPYAGVSGSGSVICGTCLGIACE